MVLALACVIQIISLVAVEFPPLQDYPNHLLRMHVLARLNDVPIYAQHIAPDPGFHPNLLADWYLALLTRWMPLLPAGKVLLCTVLVLAAVAAWVYVRTFGGNVLAALVVTQLSASWFFLKGNLNFHIGVSLGLVYLALLWPRSGRLRTWPGVLALLVSVAMLCAHGFVFLVFAGLVGVTSLIGDGWRSRQAWARVATTIPGGLVFLFFLVGQVHSSSLAENRLVYSSKLLDLVLWNPLMIWQRFQPRADAAIGAFCCGLLLVGVVATALRATRHESSGQASRGANPVLLFALTAVALYVAAPDRLSDGWGHMKFRIAHITVMLSLPLLAAIEWRGIRWVATGVLAASCVASAALTLAAYRRFDHDAQQLIALGDNVPKDSLLLPLDSAPLDQPVRPYLHFWSYICIRRNCLSPYLKADRYIQNIYFKQPLVAPPEGPDGWNWPAISEALSKEPYSAVLLRGKSPAVEANLAKVMRLAKATDGGSIFVRDAGEKLARSLN